MAYIIHIAIMIGIYAVIILGLRFATCYGAVLIVTPTVFFAVGAYATAVLAGRHAWPVSVTFVAGVLIAGVLGVAVGLISSRLKGDYLLLASLGICEITRSLLNNLDEVTGGAIGIMNIPSMFTFLPIGLRMLATLAMVAVVLVLCLLFSIRVHASPFGRIQLALKEDEIGTSAMGRHVARVKILSAMWGGIWMAIAGSIFVTDSSYVDPSSFGVSQVIMLFAMFVLGGMKTVTGSISGVAFLVILPEGLRVLGLPASIASPLRQVLSGIAMLGVMFWGRQRSSRGREV